MSFICIPMRMNLIKAHGEKGFGPFSFERSATFPPQADHVLVDLFFIHGRLGGCVKAPRQSSPWFVIFSFLHSFIIFISCPASLYILSHQILYYSKFQITYFAPLSSQPILPSSFLTLFSFKILFSLQLLVSISHSYYFCPIQTHKTYCLVKGHLISFSPALKYSHALSTFDNLCQLVVVRLGVVALFFQFYLQSFTNSVFQISNFSGLSYSFFHLKFLFCHFSLFFFFFWLWCTSLSSCPFIFLSSPFLFFFLFPYIPNFNFSLSQPGFCSSLLVFPLPLSFHNHFPSLQISLKLFFVCFFPLIPIPPTLVLAHLLLIVLWQILFSNLAPIFLLIIYYVSFLFLSHFTLFYIILISV